MKAIATRPLSIEKTGQPISYPALASTDLVPPHQTRAFHAARRNVLFGTISTLVLGAAVSILISNTVVAGAVVAQGTLVVETGSKQIQHLHGGTVTELLVRNGDVVVEGQPLVRLDSTVLMARARNIDSNLAQQQLRLVRLTAERDGKQELDFTSEHRPASLTDEEWAAAVAVEKDSFHLRFNERNGQRLQIAQRISQAENEIEGQTAQQSAADQDILLSEAQLSDLRKLLDSQLVSADRIFQMELRLSQTRGTQGALRAAIASNRGKIAELELMKIQIDQTLRAELSDQISTAQSAIFQLTEQAVSTALELAQSTLVAPQAGIVHELAVHTVGGVIQPAQTLMLIVPRSDRLVGEVRLRPSDVDQVYSGQSADINFSAFDRGTTPAVQGRLVSVSPDLVQDQHTGGLYYVARVETNNNDIEGLENLTLVAGMPLEVFIKTEQRTVLSYLIKPLTDQMNRAFR